MTLIKEHFHYKRMFEEVSTTSWANKTTKGKCIVCMLNFIIILIKE